MRVAGRLFIRAGERISPARCGFSMRQDGSDSLTYRLTDVSGCRGLGGAFADCDVSQGALRDEFRTIKENPNQADQTVTGR